MIIQIDTTKIPDKNILFIAELILLSGKNQCTVDQSIEECKKILNKTK